MLLHEQGAQSLILTYSAIVTGFWAQKFRRNQVCPKITQIMACSGKAISQDNDNIKIAQSFVLGEIHV